MYKYIGFLEFQKKFSTEKKCWNFLVKKRWSKSFHCPHCGYEEYYFVSTRQLFECRRCHYQTSLTANTVFHKTRTPLQKWFWAIYLITTHKNGISARQLQKMLEFGCYKTAWTMLHKIRNAMTQRDAHYQLAGLIEMDDSYFGQKKTSGKAGRGATKKTPVLAAIEVPDNKKPRFAILESLTSVSANEIQNKLTSRVKDHQIIKTDGYATYKTLRALGYYHYPKVLKEKSLIQEHLPWVHILISNVKAAIRATFHGVSTKHLQRYLDEYIYRFNRRFTEHQLFDRLLTACVFSKTITFTELKT